MVQPHLPFRIGSKAAIILPILAFLILTSCTKKTEQSNQKTGDIYYNINLHLDGKRSEQLGVPADAYYTPSGELFSGVQKGYYSENDSLYMEEYFKDGINTKSVFYMKNGNVNRLIHTRYLNKSVPKEIYTNGVLLYQNVPPTESKDGMGHLRTWHKNGQLGTKVSYTGEQAYQGLATEYDKEGKIIKQERYKDDEVVEQLN